jgi:hypothetical protein
MKKLKLKGGDFVLLDNEDFEWLSSFHWVKRPNGYVVASLGHRGHVYMHHLIFFLDKLPRGSGIEIDHINGNGLDNRRANLRLCTRAENSWNRGLQSNNSSGYKGVCWNKRRKKWMAGIKVDGKSKHLGLFLKAEDAARAYNKAAKKQYGDFARLNEY